MADGTDKVCPNCGHYYFSQRRVATQMIRVNGEGQYVDEIETIEDQADPNIQCEDCSAEYSSIEELVDEAYFHEVISQQE